MALTCDICGGKLSIGAGGIAVCEICGMEHSVERLREKVAELNGGAIPAAPAAAPAPASNERQIANYFDLAKTSAESGNNEKAEEYANKILELEPRHAEAWLLKGKAAGWQSTGASSRVGEAVECWIKAVEYAPEDQKDDMRSRVIEAFKNLAFAIINLHANNFERYPSEENCNSLKNAYDRDYSKAAYELGQRAEVFLPDEEQFDDTLIERLNSAAVGGSNTADAEFGPEESQKTQHAYKLWLDRTDNCLAILSDALIVAHDAALIKQIHENMKVIQTAAINSQSYRYDAHSGGYCPDLSLTAESKDIRRKQLVQWQNNTDIKLKAIRDAEELMRKVNAEMRKERIDAYWEEHPERKQELDEQEQALTARKNELEAKIGELDEVRRAALMKAKATVPAAAEQERTLGEIIAARNELASLGAFKNKEKKALQEKIDQLVAKNLELIKQVNEQKKAQEEAANEAASANDGELQELNAQLAECNEKLAAVKEELTADRPKQ